MSRGHPDYNQQSFDLAVSTIDNADIVATQRGFLRVDGLGRILFFDDFREGLARWTTSPDGDTTRIAAKYVQAKAFGFAPSCFLQANALAQSSEIQVHVSSTPPRYIGVEAAVNMQSVNPYFYLGVFGANVQGQAKQGLLRFDLYNSQIAIYSGGLYPNIVTGLTGSYFVGKWSIVKLVIDLDTQEYLHAYVLGRKIDLSGYATYLSANSIEGAIGAVASIYGTSYGTPASAYLGYIMITSDEP